MSVDPTSEDWIDGYKTAEAEFHAELWQAQKERDDVVIAGAMAHEHVKRERDRYRDALERIEKLTAEGWALDHPYLNDIARNALAGDK